MSGAERAARNAERLSELHPWLRPKVAAVLRDLEGHGWRPRIHQAWRSTAEQAEAYRLGRSKLRWGFHQATGAAGAPEALAADIVQDDAPYREPRQYLLMLASSARAHGLETGIRFGLTYRQVLRVRKAVADRDWGFGGPIGWDGWHVQPPPRTLTVAQARAGKRPKEETRQ